MPDHTPFNLKKIFGSPTTGTIFASHFLKTIAEEPSQWLTILDHHQSSSKARPLLEKIARVLRDVVKTAHCT
jgi:hypothetical protein